MQDAPLLRIKAANLRQLADFSANQKIYEDLMELVAEYEAEAAKIEALSGESPQS
jgi:hypothetical protein